MSRGVFVVVKPGAFSAQESSSRPVKGPHIFMAGHPDAVGNFVGIFVRAVVVKSREKYDFLSVVYEGTEVSAAYKKNAPKDNERPSVNLFTAFRKLLPGTNLSEQGFWKRVSTVDRVEGMGTKTLKSQRSNFSFIGYCQNNVCFSLASTLCPLNFLHCVIVCLILSFALQLT